MDFGICLEESSRALPGEESSDNVVESTVQLRDAELLSKFLRDHSGKYRLYVLDFFEPLELYRLIDEHSSNVKLVMQASVKSSPSPTESENLPTGRVIMKAYLLAESVVLVLKHLDSRILSKLLSTDNEVQRLLAEARDVMVLSSESISEFRSKTPINLRNTLFTVSNSFLKTTTEPVGTFLPSPNVVKHGAAFFLTYCEMLGKPSNVLIYYAELNEVPYELKAFSTFIQGCADLKEIHPLLPKLIASNRMNPVLSSNLFV